MSFERKVDFAIELDDEPIGNCEDGSDETVDGGVPWEELGCEPDFA